MDGSCVGSPDSSSSTSPSLSTDRVEDGENLDFMYSLALSLLKKLCREEAGNFVFSPISLVSCLGMLAVGLKGESKTELLKIIKAPDENSLHTSFKNLYGTEESPLKIANKMLLCDEGFFVREEAESALREIYRCEIDLANFAGNLSRIQGEVNAWIAEKTDHKIPELFTDHDMYPKDVLWLLNGTYFRGQWRTPLVPNWWRSAFTLRNRKVVSRRFMVVVQMFPYLETDRLRLAVIPYQEADFSMVVAMPRNEEEFIDEVLAEMSTSELMRTIQKVRSSEAQKLILRMPKFRIRYRHEGLKKQLEELGLSRIFNGDRCDFGNLFSKARKNPSVAGIVLHAAIEVNEHASDTCVATLRKQNWIPPGSSGRTFELYLRRPFCFWIVSGKNIVSLAGICADP